MTVSDYIWTATALLQREHPDRAGFGPGEVLQQVMRLNPELDVSTVRAHISQHCRDPILALSGIGKEMWRRLGGGDAFIRELREDSTG